MNKFFFIIKFINSFILNLNNLTSFILFFFVKKEFLNSELKFFYKIVSKPFFKLRYGAQIQKAKIILLAMDLFFFHLKQEIQI